MSRPTAIPDTCFQQHPSVPTGRPIPTHIPLIDPQQNALGVDFSQPEPDHSRNNKGSHSFETWLASHHPNSVTNLVESLLISDINSRQLAFAKSGINPDNGQLISNGIDNTVYQQLQGFNHKKTQSLNKIMSSSPQTPRDGAALFSSIGPASAFGGAGTNKSVADFDFDMLAASFLNDQVTAFDGLSTQPPATQNKADSFFAALPVVGSPLNFFGQASSTSPPLQNAFRNFSSANMLDAASISIPHQPMPTRNNSAFSVSSADSVSLASPAFDAVLNSPYNLNNRATNGSGLLYNSPNYSGVDTPALVPDDGNDLAASLATSPMWGQLDLGSISLFPQQQALQKHVMAEKRTATPLQQLPSLPTVSPQELTLPLLEGNVTQKVTPASAAVLNKANKKRARGSPAFGGDNDNIEEGNVDDDNDDDQRQQNSKRARRSVSASVAPTGSFNGTRHTSSAPLPLDAPTQPRTYHGPESKTSKRAVPAAAARKVAAIKAQAEMFKRSRRSASIADDATEQNVNAEENGEEIEGEFKEAIEMSIEAKRRQNTIAARRSRARKADHLAGLENSIKELTERVSMLENEKMVWMMRAMAAGWTDGSRPA